MKFEVGKEYIGIDKNIYKVLSITGNNITFLCNNIIRHFKFIQYCGIDTVIQYGKPLIKAGKIIPIFDSEIDIKIKQKPTLILNTNIKGYIDVFKKHKNK